MDLLHVPTRLGLPLLGGSELRAHISSQPGLLDEAVPFCLLLMEEPGFVLATSNDTQKSRPVSIYINPWFFSTIANIANRAPVSTYIS